MRILALASVVAGLVWTPSNAQVSRSSTPLVDPNTGALIQRFSTPHRGEEWVRFDLDFPGGRPSELIKALSAATGKPVNGLVSEDDDSEYRIPAFKVSRVTLDQVFWGLRSISTTQVRMEDGDRYWMVRHPFGFECVENPAQPDSVWAFTAADTGPQTRKWEFFSLGPYLESSPVEDITTVIETGWEMVGVDPVPDMRYHPETKMLIVVGSEQGLRVAHDALANLEQKNAAVGVPGQGAIPVGPRIIGPSGNGTARKTEPGSQRNPRVFYSPQESSE